MTRRAARRGAVAAAVLTAWTAAAGHAAPPGDALPLTQARVQALLHDPSHRLPEGHPLVLRVRRVFDRVLAAVEPPRGQTPRLAVLKDDTVGNAVSLPDRTVVLFTGAVARCDRWLHASDDCLAFVLAHELAHVARGHGVHAALWVARGFAGAAATPEVLAELGRLASGGADLASAEVEADDEAAVTMSVAGFDLGALVALGDAFFTPWEAATDPAVLSGRAGLRAKTVGSRLEAMHDALPLFEAGNRALEIGRYGDAVELYRAYAQVHAGAEVELVLGAVHLLRALDALGRTTEEERARAFPEERDGFVRLVPRVEGPARPTGPGPAGLPGLPVAGGPSLDADAVRRDLREARRYLERVRRRRPDDAVAATDLGVVLDLQGEHLAAVGAFDAALELRPGFRPALIDRAIAQLSDARVEVDRSRLDLHDARDDPIALLDLGLLERRAGRSLQAAEALRKALAAGLAGEARRRARRLLGLPPEPPANPAKQVALRLPEGTARAGDPVESWTTLLGPPARHEALPLGAHGLQLLHFPAYDVRLFVVGEAVEVAESGPRGGRTPEGRGPGDFPGDLARTYGPPGRRVDHAFGTVLLWPERGLAFDVRAGAVHSWYAYLP